MLIEQMRQKLKERYDGHSLPQTEDELFEDVYVTLAFSFSSELAHWLIEENPFYSEVEVDDIINGICIDGLTYQFPERTAYVILIWMFVEKIMA